MSFTPTGTPCSGPRGPPTPTPGRASARRRARRPRPALPDFQRRVKRAAASSSADTSSTADASPVPDGAGGFGRLSDRVGWALLAPYRCQILGHICRGNPCGCPFAPLRPPCRCGRPQGTPYGLIAFADGGRPYSTVAVYSRFTNSPVYLVAKAGSVGAWTLPPVMSISSTKP